MSNEIKEVVEEPDPAEQRRSLLAAKVNKKYGKDGELFAMKILQENPEISEKDFWMTFEWQYSPILRYRIGPVLKTGRLID